MLLACEQPLLVGWEARANAGGESGSAGMPTVPSGGAAGGAASECVPACAVPSDACIAGRCRALGPQASFAVGSITSCALQGQSLYCWGGTSSGQLGIDVIDELPHPEPERLQLEGVSDISGLAGEHFMARLTDGTIWAWGNNYAGGLGLGDDLTRSQPVRVGARSDWLTIAADSGHSCASDRAGALFCWGRGEDGELGLGSFASTSAPALVDAGPWAALSVGWGHTCGIKPDGSLWCWGRNTAGELGVGDTEPRTVPARVAEAERWVFVSAEGLRTCAIREADAALFCWGDNQNGQLGVGDREARQAPVLVAAGERFRMVAGGRYATCAITEASGLWCWGALGSQNSAAPDPSDRLLPVSEGDGFDWVKCGYLHCCARRQDNELWCWGRNEYGQLGSEAADAVLEAAPVALPP
jgi:alpha-tubulin suppressor-like RCC1 family protein